MTRVVHVPYVVEQDEDGVWCASAQLRPGVGAVGDGPTAEAAVADLRDALEAVVVPVHAGRDMAKAPSGTSWRSSAWTPRSSGSCSEPEARPLGPGLNAPSSPK